MLVRVFTLSFEPATGRFNDDPVRDFIADKEVATISDHFFVKDEAPYLVLVVRYRLAGPVAAPPASAPAGARQRDESWRTTLDAADWPLFNTLRDWRGEQSRAAGIPSYVICNNRELAAVISPVGWVERSETHRLRASKALIAGFRCALPSLQFARGSGRQRILAQSLQRCHAGVRGSAPRGSRAE